ncbi:MAG TPA: type 1 glutamine amidotransferase [Dehalococcoidia bacterium]|nr:type 1 glutamine amidotransferase [Dehalococcoidia bacterium]
MFEGLLIRRDISYRYVKLYEGESIPDLGPYSGVVLLGGPMNVYEEEAYPFLKREDAYIQQVLALGVPFLGICLGGQLLAKAVGGVVTRNGVREIGWHTVELDLQGQRDPLFAGLPESLPVFQWHGDTFSIPKGAIRLATSPACENQAFRCGFGGIAYALQFHLEVTPAMVEEWVREYGGELEGLRGLVTPASVLAQTPPQCERLRDIASRVFTNFCRLSRLRYAGIGSALPEQPSPAKSTSARDEARVARAWQAYRALMAKGQLRCGVTCPLDRIGQCTGGCW